MVQEQQQQATQLQFWYCMNTHTQWRRIQSQFSSSLRRYHKEYNKLMSFASQLSSVNASYKRVLFVKLNFCGVVKFLEPIIAHGFIPGVKRYETLYDVQMRKFLEGHLQK